MALASFHAGPNPGRVDLELGNVSSTGVLFKANQSTI